MIMSIPKQLTDIVEGSHAKLNYINLNHFKDIQISTSAQHFQSLVTILRDYTELRFQCLEIRNEKPSKVNKHLKQLEKFISRTPVLISNKLSGLKMTGITAATGFQSLVWRQLLKGNRESITKIKLEYKADVLREETRILCEEVGLSNLTKLEELTLHMNRGTNLKEICEFFENSTMLTKIDLSNNVFQTPDCQ